MPKKQRRPAQDVDRPSYKQPFPAFFAPMGAQSVAELPDAENWLYELKLDGYRSLLFKDGATVRLRSRNDKDLAVMYPAVVSAGRRLKAEQAVLDGEIVALDSSGRPSFQALQHRGSYPQHVVVMVAFDLTYLNGASLMDRPIEERREKLGHVLDQSGVLFSPALPGTAAEVVRAVQERDLEGVIAKRKGSRYIPGDATDDWLKLKLERNEEFVIGGYRPGSNGVDALLVGYYEGRNLQFAARPEQDS